MSGKQNVHRGSARRLHRSGKLLVLVEPSLSEKLRWTKRIECPDGAGR